MRKAGGAIALVMLLSGCSSPPKGFDSPVPALRLQAITHAAETEDRASIPDLIDMLDSDDPLVRMAAIRSLERITGTTMGYQHAAPEQERRAHVSQWADWYRRTGGLSGPEAGSNAEGSIPTPEISDIETGTGEGAGGREGKAQP